MAALVAAELAAVTRGGAEGALCAASEAQHARPGRLGRGHRLVGATATVVRAVALAVLLGQVLCQDRAFRVDFPVEDLKDLQ